MAWWIVAAGIAIVLLGGLATSAETEQLTQSFGKPLSDFADAVGHAEGVYTVGSRPYRNNNPGDMILAPPASNYTDKSDGTYAVFDSMQDGWQALEDQLDLIRRGASARYNPNMTFTDMAAVYSPQGNLAWAKNVSIFLGAAPGEKIGGYL